LCRLDCLPLLKICLPTSRRYIDLIGIVFVLIKVHLLSNDYCSISVHSKCLFWIYIFDEIWIKFTHKIYLTGMWFYEFQLRFMARCTRYNIMWETFSLTYGRSVVFSGYSDFLSTKQTDRHATPFIPWSTTLREHYSYIN
jgi:hypothetical protein